MPNTVVKLTNAESTWLEAAREDRKLLINMKAHLQNRVFSSAQDDDTRGRKGSHLGDTLHVLELAVLYYDMRRSVFLVCHEGRSGGIFLADR